LAFCSQGPWSTIGMSGHKTMAMRRWIDLKHKGNGL
jgi:hypothetical protein